MTISWVRQPSSEAPELLTERTRLRGHRVSDLDSLARMWADEAVVRYISAKPSTRQESWARLLRYVGHWSLLGFGYWAIEDRHTGEYIGELGFADFKRAMTPSLDGIPEAGWLLAPEAQGQGIATEAMTAVLRWADANFIGDRIAAIFDPAHERSIRLAARCGFVVQGEATVAGNRALLMSRRRPLL